MTSNLLWHRKPCWVTPCNTNKALATITHIRNRANNLTHILATIPLILPPMLLRLTFSPPPPVWGAAALSCSSPSSLSSPGWWPCGWTPSGASASFHRTPRHSYGSEQERDTVKQLYIPSGSSSRHRGRLANRKEFKSTTGTHESVVLPLNRQLTHCS